MKADICGKLQLSGCRLVSTSPDKPNIYYEVVSRQDVETDMNSIASQVKETTVEMPRMIIYRRSRNLCADLYQFFLHYLGETSYYPLGAPKLCINQLFGMYHANIPSHNKQVIMQSMEKVDGIVRVVFATVALGMGVNFVGLKDVLHYGAPSTIEDYFQESGRAGRSGELSTSTNMWKPSDAPLWKDLSRPCHAEVAAVRHYLENDKECHREQLLHHFVRSMQVPESRELLFCCDVCGGQFNSEYNPA